MPTESEFDQYNRPIESEFDRYNQKLDTPEIKPDESPRHRLAFLDRVQPCVTCIRIRHVVLYSLALYGLYSLIF